LIVGLYRINIMVEEVKQKSSGLSKAVKALKLSVIAIFYTVILVLFVIIIIKLNEILKNLTCKMCKSKSLSKVGSWLDDVADRVKQPKEKMCGKEHFSNNYNSDYQDTGDEVASMNQKLDEAVQIDNQLNQDGQYF